MHTSQTSLEQQQWGHQARGKESTTSGADEFLAGQWSPRSFQGVVHEARSKAKPVPMCLQDDRGVVTVAKEGTTPGAALRAAGSRAIKCELGTGRKRVWKLPGHSYLAQAGGREGVYLSEKLYLCSRAGSYRRL